MNFIIQRINQLSVQSIRLQLHSSFYYFLTEQRQPNTPPTVPHISPSLNYYNHKGNKKGLGYTGFWLHLYSIFFSTGHRQNYTGKITLARLHWDFRFTGKGDTGKGLLVKIYRCKKTGKTYPGNRCSLVYGLYRHIQHR